MAEDTSQEKTEEPTERRLTDSRKKGQTARSKELNILLSLMAASIGMVFLGQYLMTDLHALMTQGLAFEPSRIRIQIRCLRRFAPRQPSAYRRFCHF